MIFKDIVIYFMKKKYTIVGIDEAGRGPLAGPVVAASVIIEEKYLSEKINDSKKINQDMRQMLYQEILQNAIKYSVGIVSSNEIDELNIHNATLKAMKISFDAIDCNDCKVYIDGLFAPNIDANCITIKHGDQLVPIISAAAIVAKVTRDKIMLEIDREYPEYDFKKHKGYPTKKHIEMIKKYGICKYHRRTFKPISLL